MLVDDETAVTTATCPYPPSFQHAIAPTCGVDPVRNPAAAALVAHCAPLPQ